MKLWRYAKWPLAVLALGYLALVGYRIWAIGAEERTAEAVAAIHAMRLTMADVDGSNLPPRPSPAAAGATVEGIDANDNGIRDDVELAIFEKYQNDVMLRAAILQYAKALQLVFSSVTSTETLEASSWEESRAFFCIDQYASNSDFEQEIAYAKQLILNTEARINTRELVYEKHMSSHGSPNADFCDIKR